MQHWRTYTVHRTFVVQTTRNKREMHTSSPVHVKERREIQLHTEYPYEIAEFLELLDRLSPHLYMDRCLSGRICWSRQRAAHRSPGNQRRNSLRNNKFIAK